MRLACHGGMCCGIKHIFEMGLYPAFPVPALKEVGSNTDDISYNFARQDKRFFHPAAPVETHVERLDRYLAFLDSRRPSEIVEITLVLKGSHAQTMWVPIIEERGFREVTPEGGVYNSNSGNCVGVFHRYTRDGEVIK